MTSLPAGAYTALVTPFSPDGSSVDWGAFEALIASQLEGKITGLIPCGTTGEGATLSDSEQRELTRRTVNLAKGKATVVVGTGSNNTKKTIESSKAALEAGAGGVMLVMPYYTKPSQEGLFQHITSVAAAVDCPVMLYNIPGRTNVDLAVDTLLRVLDAAPNVVAIKDASGNVSYCQDLLARAEGRILVLSGDDALTVPMMSVGAGGVVSVTSNVYPRGVSDIVADMLGGRLADAMRKDKRLLAMHRALFCEPSPQPVKAALALQGRIADSLRLPLVSAGDACKARLREAMAAFEAA